MRHGGKARGRRNGARRAALLLGLAVLFVGGLLLAGAAFGDTGGGSTTTTDPTQATTAASSTTDTTATDTTATDTTATDTTATDTTATDTTATDTTATDTTATDTTATDTTATDTTATDTTTTSATPSPSTASLSADKANYVAGDTVTLTGTGFAAGESVSVHVSDTGASAWTYDGSATAASDGSFTASFQLPSLFASTFAATATGASGDSASVNVTDTMPPTTSTATLATDKTNYVAGDTVTLTGTGFAAGESVGVHVADSGASAWTYDGSTKAASDGSFTASFQLPSLFASTFTATATGASGDSASVNITDALNASEFTPAIQTDKADYAPGSTVTISGSGWPAYDTLTVFTNDTIGNTWSNTGNPTTDANGEFTYTVTLPKTFISNYTTSAKDAGGLTATTSFTDAGDAASGDGTMTVSPLTATAGSTGNAFTFTFLSPTSKNFNPGSQVTLQVPAGWTAPTAGNVTVAVGPSPNCTSATLGTITGTGPWTIPVTINCPAKDQFTITYSGVTAPAAGSYTFTTASQQSSPPGTLVNLTGGSPSVTVTAAPHTTMTSIGCSPASVAVTSTTVCTATVTDTNGSPTTPTGTVASWATSVASGGTFYTHGTLTTSNTCTLSAVSTGVASCELDFVPALNTEGTQNITGSYGGDGTHATTNNNLTPFALAVTKANQATLSVTGPSSATYGAADQTITTSGGSGTGALSFSAGSSTACTIASNKLHVSSGTGTCSVTATMAADANYNQATSAPFTVTINKANQATLSVTGPGSATYGAADQTITTSGGSGTGALSFSAGSSTACTIATNKLHVSSGTGTCSVTATMAGDANYNQATSAPFSVTINRALLTITASNASKAYGQTTSFAGTEFTPTGLVNGDTISSVTLSSTGAGATADAGTYTIVPSAAVFSSGSASNYTITYANGTLTVNPAPLTITANNQSKAYGQTIATGAGQTAFTPSGLQNGDSINMVTLSSTGAAATAPVSGSPYPIVPSAAHFTGGASASNYSITYVNGALTVNPASLTVTANNQSKTYGAALTLGSGQTAFTPSGLVNGDTVSSVTLSSAGAAASALVAGSPYSIVPSAAVFSPAAASNNYTITYHNGALTVTPAALQITASSGSSVYGATPGAVTASYLTFVNGDTAASLSPGPTCVTTATASSPVGSYATSCSGAADPNYSISYMAGSWSVTPATLTITAKDESKTYGTTFTPDGTTQFSTSGLVNSDSVSSVMLSSGGYAGTATVVSPGPTYTITPSAAVGSGLGNYTIGYDTGTFAVDPATLTITAKDESKTYGTTFTPDGTTQFSTSGLVNSDSVSSVMLSSGGYAGTATVVSPGPTYTITPSAAVGSGLGNYTIGYDTGTFAVDPATLTITAKDESKTYGTTFTPDGTTQFSTSGLVNSDSVSSVMLSSGGYAGTATVVSPGPTYTITPSAAVGSGLGNYTIGYDTGTFAVDPATLTITAKDESKTYGTTFTPDGTTQFSTSGLVNSDSVSSVMLSSGGYAGTATVVSPGPTYTITPSAAVGSGLGNYTIGYDTGTFAVDPATLTITAKDESKTYGTTFTPDGTTQFSTSGLVNSDSVSSVMLSSGGYAGTATVVSPGPTYTITPSAAVGSGLGNYTIGYDTGTFAVDPATLTITAKDESKTYGTTFTPDGTTQFSTSGLVNSDSVSSVMLSSGGYAGTATVVSPGPTYTITPSAAVGSGLGNYTIGYDTGTFAVDPATLTITAKDESKTYGTTFTPDGTTQFSTSGLVNSDSVSSVMLSSGGYAGTATVVSPGPTYTITPSAAVGSGLGNYTIGYDTGTFAVDPATLTITAKDESKTYGTTFTPDGTTQFSTSGLVNSDSVSSVMLSSGGYAGTATVVSPGPTYTITPSAAVGSGLGNYTIGYDTGTFAVDPATLTITAKDESKTYGTTFTPDGTTQFSTSGLVNSDSVSSVMLSSGGYAGTATVVSPGPTYTITPSAAVGSGLGNYTIGYDTGTFAVDPATLTITAKDESKTYGTTFTPDGTTQFSTSGLVNSDSVSSVMLSSGGYAGTATVVSPGPTYTITPSAAVFSPAAASGNYTITYKAGTITVTARPLTITANSFSKLYGTAYTFAGTEFSVAPTDLVSGLVNGDSVTSVSLSSTGAAATATVTAPGPTYAITASAAAGSGLGNYTITYKAGTITVTARPLTITANSFSKLYGTAYTFAGTEFSVAPTDLVSGLVNGDSVTSVSLSSTGAAATATVTAPGPTYAITASAAAGSGLGNYTITYKAGTITVTARPLTITANSFSKLYGTAYTFAGTEFSVAPTDLVSGLVNGDSVTSVSLSSTGAAATATVTAPGPTYAITASAAAGSGLGNYTITYKAGTITVTARPLTITANSFSKLYGTAYTFAGTEFSVAPTDLVSGLVNGDSVTSVSLSSTGAAATATVTAPGPTYAITASAAAGSGLGNYTITYKAGTITVKTAPLTITAKNISKQLGTAYAPVQTSPGDFTVTGLLNSDSVASVTLSSAGYAAAATVASPGPTYPITPSAAAGTGLGNYTISYVNGTLSVVYGSEVQFLQPINGTAHNLSTNPDVSTFKAGSTVPVKVEVVLPNGTIIQPGSAHWITPQQGSATNQPVDETVYTVPATSGLDFTWEGQFDQYNWGTPKSGAGYYWLIGVQLDDGQTYTVYISLH